MYILHMQPSEFRSTTGSAILNANYKQVQNNFCLFFFFFFFFFKLENYDSAI